MFKTRHVLNMRSLKADQEPRDAPGWTLAQGAE